MRNIQDVSSISSTLTARKMGAMYEITQNFGDGETHPFLSPTDEFADYGTWDSGNLDFSAPKTEDMLRYEYAREALKNGLALKSEARNQSI